MLVVDCDVCGMSLQEFGAILLSPPEDRIVSKYHICVACFEDIQEEYILNAVK